MSAAPYLRHFNPRTRTGAEPVWVNGIGIREIMEPGLVDRPGVKDDYLIMTFYGPVEVNEGKETIKKSGGCLRIWEPGVWQHYGNDKKRWNHTWIHVTGKSTAELLSTSGLLTGKTMSVQDPAFMEKILFILHAEIIRYPGEDPVIVKNLFENLVREISRNQKSGVASAVPGNIRELKTFIEKNYAKTHSLKDLAERAGLSANHLLREYRRATGFAPYEHIVRLRMMEASFLIDNRNLKIREVAERVGYEDFYQFSRLFKRHLGKSPRAYRTRQG